MPSAIRWADPQAVATAMSTQLNALAHNARALGPAVTGNRLQLADFELLASFAVSPSAGGYAALYLVPALDGTDYADGDASVAPPATLWVGNFPLRSATGAQRVVLRGVVLPPLDFKPLLENQAGQAMASTGNTLRYRAYGDEVE